MLFRLDATAESIRALKKDFQKRAQAAPAEDLGSFVGWVWGFRVLGFIVYGWLRESWMQKRV